MSKTHAHKPQRYLSEFAVAQQHKRTEQRGRRVAQRVSRAETNRELAKAVRQALLGESND